jgi:two-component system chemotaxis response regulator CheB
VNPAKKIEAVAIGASAGAIDALSEILPALPEKFPFPIFIVVHVPPDTNSVLADIFVSRCRLRVKEAEDKELIQPGVVYFAPPNYHLLVEEDGTLSLSSDEPELFSRPSINVLFESAADAYGDSLLGIVLTGASADGARGLRAVGAAGGMAVVQEPDSAEVSIMPRAALEACAGARPLLLPDIASLLANLPEQNAPAC